MMYYRRKILLALLEEFGGELANTDFQKLLFLFTERQEERSYDFVPYKYGCFSFQSYADKRTLTKYRYLEDKDHWILSSKGENYHFSLRDTDRKELVTFKKQFAHLHGTELLLYVYRQFPYYAINSEIASELLSQKELLKISRYKPKQNDIALFTLGYEGTTLECYLNKLVEKNVKVLCDVRKNALSMKYGFSKRQLQDACEEMAIKYTHIPSLGIISNKRKNLNTKIEYNTLFDEYEKTTLIKELKSLHYIYQLLIDQRRLALTCFEEDHNRCHRGRVANALSQLPGWKYPIYHL